MLHGILISCIDGNGLMYSDDCNCVFYSVYCTQSWTHFSVRNKKVPFFSIAFRLHLVRTFFLLFKISYKKKYSNNLLLIRRIKNADVLWSPSNCGLNLRLNITKLFFSVTNLFLINLVIWYNLVMYNTYP